MKPLRSLFLLILLGITISLPAAYLEYMPQKVTQPDGTTLNCFASGDEYYHWLHDARGFTIVLNRETGYFVFADRAGDDLIPTNLVPGVDDPAANGLRPGINISSSKYREYFNSRFKDTSLKSDRIYTNTGNYNNLVIFIRFSNQNEYTEPLSGYSTAFNGSATVSMTEYFKEVSKSQLNISTTFYPKPAGSTIISYQDSHSRRYYQPYSVSNTEGYRTDNEYVKREMTLLKNAVEFVKVEAEASGVNYDHDNDHNVDNVCFIIQGPTDGWSDLLWPHRWVLQQGYDVLINGARVHDFNFQLSEALGVSVLCHEMFHSLGSPDLYRYVNDDITPVGPWDLMAHNKTPPQHMSAYMKMKYGKWFSQIPTITSDGTYSLKPLATDAFAAYKLLSPNSASEFFILEYRKATGRFESGLVGSGLIITRVNPSLEGNAQGPPDEVYVYRQNGTSRGDGNINNATFSSSVGRTEFGDNTNPTDFLSNGTLGGIRISNVGAIGETITFTVGTGGALNPPRELTAILNGRDISLAWKQPEAGSGTLTGYTVYRNQAVISTINNPGTVTFSQTGMADGTWQYHVTARYSSPSGESAPSNYVTVNVSSVPKPDLIISNPAVMPDNVEPGDSVTVTCTLENRGNAGSGICMLRVYLSQDATFDSGDRQLAEGSLNALAAGSSIGVRGEDIPVPEGTNNGKWFVLFIADADGAVTESIENNNQALTMLTVGNPALNPPRSLVAKVSTATVNLSWMEPEPGGGTLAGYYIYRNGNKINTLNSPGSLDFTDTGLALGVYTYFVTAFYSTPAGESPHSNEVTVTLSNDAKPDLTAQDLVVTPSSVSPGASMDITCSVLNIGSAAAAESEIRLYLSKDLVQDENDIYLAYGNIDAIEAGGEMSVSGRDISIPDNMVSGSWNVLFIVDATQAIDETNELNNMAISGLIIQGEVPDLQILSVSLYPLIITPKFNARISSIIYNGGNAVASPVEITYFLSPDEILDTSDKELFDESTRFLGAKGTIQLSGGFTIQSTVLPGQYFLIGVMDIDGVVNESDETNNQIVQPVIVVGTSGIDDGLTDSSFRVYPVPAKDWLNVDLSMNPGENATIYITDVIGNEVYRHTFISMIDHHFRLDVSNWVKGTYLISCRTSKHCLTRKILLQ